MTVITGGDAVELRPMDICCVAGGEVREIVNCSNHVCKMLEPLYPALVAA